MVEKSAGEFRYWAFLSYSHKDATAARTLHRRLETYRIPARLAGTSTALGRVPDRLWPIFRDRDELPAATDLSETVRRALDQSGALIILCSPEAARSLWVAEEIRTFRALHPDRPILAAILSGSPPDCFPGELRRVDAHGESHEPLATDLRTGGDGAQLGLLKLVAGITGLGLDDLVQRDAARRIRRVTAVTVGALVAMLMMAVLTSVALNARNEAERQHNEAEGLVEFMLTKVRPELKAVGRLRIMNSVNERAMAYYEAQGPLRNLSDESLERRARIIGAMGEDYENSGNFDQARSHYEALYLTTEALLNKDPSNPARILAHARSENRLGLLAITLNRLDEARPRLEATRRLLASIADWGRDRSEWLRLAAFAEGNTCATMLRRGESSAAALDHCRRAVAHNQRLVALNPEDGSASYDLVFHLSWLAEAQHAAGQGDAARATQAQYLALMDRQIRRDPGNMLWREQQMELYVRHARFLRTQGEPHAAVRFLAEARELSRELAARDPQNAVWSDYERRLSEPKTRSN